MAWQDWKRKQIGSYTIVIASEPWQKVQGLQGVKSLPFKTLMLFTELRPGIFFHTVNCLMPIDILPLDISGKVLDIWNNIRPNQEWIGPTPEHTFFVLEAPGGWAKNLKLEKGIDLREIL